MVSWWRGAALRVSTGRLSVPDALVSERDILARVRSRLHCVPALRVTVVQAVATGRVDVLPDAAGRKAKYQRQIFEALVQRFADEFRATFTGSEPYDEQALAFHRAAIVVGRMVRRLRTSSIASGVVVEFVANGRSNSALYAAYASSVFGLDYWAVVSNATSKRALGSYDDIQPADVVRTVELALRRQKRAWLGLARSHDKQIKAEER